MSALQGAERVAAFLLSLDAETAKKVIGSLAPDVVEAVLNHALPGISGVGSVYMRGELEEQKADALRLWADEVSSIVTAPTVTPVRAAS